MGGRFEGRVALITGAGSGIGRETAKILASDGASVACLDVDAGRVAETTRELEAKGGTAFGVTCDVSDSGACQDAVATTVRQFGGLDVLCNVAGVAMMRPVEEVDDALWQRMIGINLTGPFSLARSAIPALAERKGNIVNVASQAGLRGYSHLSAYSAAKGGLVMLTRSLAVELAPRAVRVNCVCPGAVITNIGESMDIRGAVDPAIAGSMQQRHPPISPAIDVARAIAFLASDEAASMTGSIVAVDGGSTA